MHRTQVQLRPEDYAPGGGLHQIALARIFSAARVSFLTEQLLTDVGGTQFVLAHFEMELSCEPLPAGSLVVETSLEKLGGSSLTLRQALGSYRARAIMVHIKAGKPQRLPESLRRAGELAAHESLD